VHEISRLLMRLNVATRHWHADVDDAWLDLLRPAVTRTDYLNQLVRMYGFIAPFESACKYTPNLTRVLDFRQLTRAGLIAQDLLALGLSPSQVSSVPQCHDIVTFAHVPEALGWLYVIERSTLLLDGIRRHVLSAMPDVSDASAYLSLYDGRVNDHWEMFGRVLDRAGAKPEHANQIQAAAHAGFDTAKHWFRTNNDRRRSTG
jgi:heme oxygenase